MKKIVPTPLFIMQVVEYKNARVKVYYHPKDEEDWFLDGLIDSFSNFTLNPFHLLEKMCYIFLRIVFVIVTLGISELLLRDYDRKMKIKKDIKSNKDD